jgi:O-antigen ligase
MQFRKSVAQESQDTAKLVSRHHKIIGAMTWMAFFCVPFLGGNHLALPGVTIDSFWITTTFLLFLISSLLGVLLTSIRTTYSLSRLFVFFTPFLLVTIISLLYTWNLYNTSKEINTLVWVLGAIYLYGSTKSKELPLKGLVWGSALAVVCAVLQMKVLFPQLSAMFTQGWYASIISEKSVPFVAFLNENMFGGFLVMVLPISLYLAFTEGRRTHVFTTLLIVAGVLISLSRLSFIVMVLELLISVAIFTYEKEWKGLLIFGVTVTAGAVLFASLIYIQRSPSEKNLQSLFASGKVASALRQVRTLNLRTSIWKSGMSAFAERPLIGYGSGTFEYAYKKHFGGRLYTRYSHGSIVKIGVELGILGLFAFLWYLYGLVRGMRGVQFHPALLFLSVLGGFLVSLVDCALDTPAFVVAFFLVSSTFLIGDRNPNPSFVRVRLSAAALLLVISFAFTARAELAKQNIEEGDLLTEMGNPTRALDSYDEALRLMPINDEGYVRSMTNLTRIFSQNTDADVKIVIAGRLKRGFLYAQRTRDSELSFVRALGYKTTGDYQNALQNIRKAINLYPSSPYYLSHAVQWCIEADQLGEASGLLDNFSPFVANIRQWGNPQGLYVYRLRDLSAQIELKRGNAEQALLIEKANLDSALKDEFIISSYKAREYVPKDDLIRFLTGRVATIESQE